MLDEAIEAALNVERAVIPGFVRQAGDTLGKPSWDQRFFDSCRRSLLELVSGRDDLGVLQVCSPGQDEGRSNVAAAMALSLCRTYGERVALLDLDFTNGALATLFGVEPTPGLADWLEQGERLRVVAGGTNRQLYFVPAGRGYRDPAWLYRDFIQKNVLEAFLRRFRWVVMDLPPLLADPAAGQLTPLGQCHVLVGRYRHTFMRDLEEAAEMVPDRRAGFVLTGYRSRVPNWLRRLI
jgi:Mrp family chromosome partitioning ATPase